jgi:hypothetical protein
MNFLHLLKNMGLNWVQWKDCMEMSHFIRLPKDFRQLHQAINFENQHYPQQFILDD